MAVLTAAVLVSPAIAGIDAWTTTGPRGGAMLLATDPTTPGRMFAASDGQLSRSSDSGTTWSPVSRLPSVQALAFRSGAPGTMFAAVGTRYLYKTTDAGVTWIRLPGAFGYDSFLTGLTLVTSLAAPGTRGELFVFEGGSLWYSADDGTTWAPRSSPQGSDVLFDPARLGVIYIANRLDGVYKSIDNGVSWSLQTIPGEKRFEPLRLAIDPGYTDRLYVFGNNHLESDPAILYATSDGGVTWSWRSTVSTGSESFPASLTVDPFDPRTLYAVISGVLLRSDDDGRIWRRIGPVTGDGVSGFATGATAGTLYLATSIDGVQRSTDGGVTWEPHNAGLVGDSVNELAVGGTTPFAYLTGHSRYRRVAGTNRWSYLAPDLFASTFAMHPATGVAYGLTTSAVWRSPDGGATWGAAVELTPNSSSRYDRVAVANNDDRIVLAAGEAMIFRFSFSHGGAAVSADGGTTWRDLAPFVTPVYSGGLLSFGAIAIDPVRPQTLWLGTGKQSASTQLLRSDDSGSSWRVATTWTDAEAAPVTAIAIDPQDSRRMIVTIAGGARVYASFDQGGTWKAVDAGLAAAVDVRALAVDWAAPSRVIYAGTYTGVYASSVDGVWTLVPGSQDLRVNALQIARPPGAADRMTIIAATGSGVFEYTADPVGRFVPVYRFFNTATSTHFYTASAQERAYVLAQYPTFQDEGIAFWALAAAAIGAKPVFRFFNTITGTHFYTAEASERDFVLATYPQLTPEGTVYYAFGDSEPGTVPAHRFFNTQTGTHFYTSADDEAIYVEQHFPQFVYEGNRYGVYPAVPRR